VRRGTRAIQHTCDSCRETFVVRYESLPDEAEETVPVACPHCWHRNYVLVAESAAESREYTAEKS
jgi:DNA-directed RNA polymerase subunit RPC12/RpoP